MHKGTYLRFPRALMRPLRISAWLQTGVLADATLPIDAVLYYAAMRERYGAQEITYPGADHSERVTGVSLPLMRCEEQGTQWYYAASFAQWGAVVAEGRDHWNKRFDLGLSDLVKFPKRGGSVNVKSAAYKAYHMPVFYRHALIVRWYIVGHQASIERLLRPTTHLGKKTSQGWGSVLRWAVEPWPDDWSVRDGTGRLMRAIPASGGLLTGYRPSYWLPKNQALCEMPADV